MSKILLDIQRKRISAESPWNPDLPRLFKGVSGAKWDPKNKVWTFPASWATCLALREVANEVEMPLKVTPEMQAWSQAERDRITNSVDSSSQELQQLPWLQAHNPGLWEAASARPFQTVGIKFGVEARHPLLADDPGLGKTLQAIGMVQEAGITGPILVVANTSAQEITWPAQLDQRTDDEYFVFNKDIPAKDRGFNIDEVFRDCAADPSKRIWVLANPFWVRMKAEVDEYGKYVYTSSKVKMVKAEVPELFQHEWGAILADESQETLATATGNAKKWSQQRQGMGALQIKPDGMRISMSGTPMRSNPATMYGQISWLYPDIYTSYWNWAKEHFVVTDDGYRGAMQVGQLLDEKKFWESISHFTLRRSKADVAKDLPPKQYGGTYWDPKDPNTVLGVWLKLGKEQRKAYDKFVETGVHTAMDGQELSANGGLALATRLKQLASSAADVEWGQEPMFKVNDLGQFIYDADDRRIPLYDDEGERLYHDVATLVPRLPSCKFDWILEYLQDRDLVGPKATGKQKVIIASQFKKTVDLFRAELENKYNTPSFVITGDTKAKDRVAYQDEFQNNPDSHKIFFLQTVAGGTSLTLDAADDVIIVDEMHDADRQLQVEDRAHRLSRMHNVTIWYLRCRDTVEEYLGTTVEARRRISLGIMDGARGVDFSQLLLGKNK